MSEQNSEMDLIKILSETKCNWILYLRFAGAQAAVGLHHQIIQLILNIFQQALNLISAIVVYVLRF